MLLLCQSFILYEDLGNDHKAQIRMINLIAGTMYQCTKFSKEDCENLITRITQSSAKLLKKPDQCRMVQVCCHLFWATKPKVRGLTLFGHAHAYVHAFLA